MSEPRTLKGEWTCDVDESSLRDIAWQVMGESCPHDGQLCLHFKRDGNCEYRHICEGIMRQEGRPIPSTKSWKLQEVKQ